MDKNTSILHDEIKLWNESRFDLFAISETNENNECFGVIRFYHQDSANNAKYATKCVRVSSSAITSDVINTLAEKFRSDMRMLTKPNYALYEVHMDGEFRKLERSERPLLVQLNWIKDDREGRFLLRNDDDARPMTVGKALYEESEDTVKGFKLARNLTKKEKKVQKKKEKGLNKNNKEEFKATPQVVISAAKQLYHQVPESTFTRTVSNPEAVMKKRREQKLQKRGAKVLKVYGDTLNPEIPYKSLLLLPSDKTSIVIRGAVDKYGLGNENTSDFSLYQIVLPPGSKPEECFEGGWGKESILGPDECPLLIDEQWQSFQGTMIFKIRRNKHGTKLDHKKLQENETSKTSQKVPHPEDENEVLQVQKATVLKEANLPSIVELTRNGIRVHSIYPNVTEIGANQASRTYGNFIQLFSDKGLQDSHCVLTSMDGIVTITPQDRVGNVMVNGEIIDETTMLYHGSVIKLGNKKALFCENDKPFAKLEILRKLGSTLTTSNDNVSKFEKHDGTANTFPNSTKQRNQSQSDVATFPKSKFLTTGNFNGEEVDKNISQPPSENLPISIVVNKNAESAFLSEILHLHGHNLHFKLSPSYSIYLTLRWFTKQLSNKTSWFIELVSHQTNSLIQTKFASVAELAFWMANISEILNFLRQDKDLCYLSSEVQDKFAKTVQLGFRHLVQCMQRTLFSLMPAFLSQSDADLPGDGDKIDLKKQQQSTDLPTMYDILRMLSSAMSLLRKCRVNAALTIQLFSQLFHSINMWLFNKLVTSGDGSGEILCTRQWGIRIRARLALIEAWAEKQGLELAADCHLARITQATYLLQAPKHTADDIAAISGTCFKLNSLQLHALLTQYMHDHNEQMIPPDMIDQVVSVAESSADELMRSDGRSVQLMEDPDLQLPFLLPEDGYSCDVVHGVPSGLIEFLQIFEQRGLCIYKMEPHSSGSWAVHFASSTKFEHHHAYTPQPEIVNKPEVVTVEINKQGGGMGLSIVAARGGETGKLGIYIRSVVKDSAADKDGRLQAGDQLLSVDGFSLVGIDQERAASLMTKTGQTVLLQIAKQGAIYQGLAMILNQPYITSPSNDLNQNQNRQSCTPPPTTVLHNLTSPPSKYTKASEKSSSTSQLNQQVEQSASLNIIAISADPTIARVKFEGHYPQSRDQDQSITSFDNPNYDKVDHLIQNMPPQNIVVDLSNKLPEEEKYSNPSFKLVESPAVSFQDISKPSSYYSHHANQPFCKQTNKIKESSKKSSTLPRHFKSNSGLHRELRGNQEQTIQDELNALRDEEINELMKRKEKLTNMEQDRLNTLQKEREFQNRIQEEKQKLFSDDEISVEDFSSIPDRPDRDRLMKDQDDQELSGKHKITLKADDIQLATDRKNRRKDYFDGRPSESGKAIYSHSKNKKLNAKLEKEEGHCSDKKLSIGKNTSFYPEYKKHEPIDLKQPTFVASKHQQQEKDNIHQIRQRIKRETHSRPPRPVSEGFALADKMRRLPMAPHSYSMDQSSEEKISKQSVLRTDPSSMTFKDRQRLFSGEGASPVTKSRSSKTLLEIERNLKNQI